MVKAWRYFLPLGIFLGLVVFLARGLFLDPRHIPSELLNKPVPVFSLPVLHTPDKTVSSADMKGQVWLLNVWGSWCVSCRYEHPVLNDLAKQGVIPIIGLNWKDKPADARTWLARYGDPYKMSLMDVDGRIAIEFGVYGAPETFIIDKAGMIRHKHTGPISPEELRDKLLPIIETLKKA